MDDRDKIIITVVFSIVGIIAAILIICFIVWFLFRHKSKSHIRPKNPSLSYRPQYERSQSLSITKFDNNKRRQRKRRFNTNDSSISLSFDPPHLINQNVKNLDKLLPLDSPLDSKVWNPENPLRTTMIQNFDRLYTPSTNEPIYTSSSSLSTPTYNPTTIFHPYQQLNSLHIQFLNELNRNLCLKQEERRASPLKYSQSCRQTANPMPYDFYRSMTPTISTSSENTPETTFNRTTKYSNATLMRKAYLGQLRDDTAILY